jgi:heterodisulfide reductase subunit D
LSAAGAARDIDVVDLHELLAESLGIKVGGSRGTTP